MFMVQEIRSLQKLAIFFQGFTLGAEGGGTCTRYFTVIVSRPPPAGVIIGYPRNALYPLF